MSRNFNETERAILRIVQADLPDSLTPYADIAAQTGSSENDVLALTADGEGKMYLQVKGKKFHTFRVSYPDGKTW